MPLKKEATKKAVLNLLNSEVNLRIKRELIQKFINENLAVLDDESDVSEDLTITG